MHHDDARCRSHQTVNSAFISQIFQGFADPTEHKLILVVRLRKAELGAFRPASAAIKRVIIGRAHDPILTPSRLAPNRRESPDHRCSATIADGEGAAQHAGLQRRSLVPRRPSRCSRAITHYYNLNASHQAFARCREDVDTAPNQAAA